MQARMAQIKPYAKMLYQLTKKEMVTRYKGTYIGLLWSLIMPLLALTMYTFVFSIVLQAKWGMAQESHYDFALLLFIGLIVHGLFSEVLTQSPGLITSQSQYVKKIRFPHQILPLVSLQVSLIHALISAGVLLLGVWIIKGSLPFTLIYLPLVALPFILLLLGMAWILAALGVYIRDIGQIAGTLSMFLLFMSPVFYSLDRLPPAFQNWLYLNPLTAIIEQARAVIFYAQTPDFNVLAIYTLVALITLVLGYKLYQKLRPGFADIL